jgi:N-methylhydantoinase A
MTCKRDLRVAVDIGGTFTDTVLARGRNDRIVTSKTTTTPDWPALGAVEGVRDVLQNGGHSIDELTGFIHGTTLATNALIERRGAVVSVITTKGFRDILEIGYERRFNQYDLNIDKPDYLVPRARCFTIPERMSFDGQVLTPLDLRRVDSLIDALVACGTEALAICLLHAYANPLHEQILRDAIHSRLPELSVCISSEVSPEAREFDRMCTTVANAYIQPLMSDYLTDFRNRFEKSGLQCPILMMTASGGMTTMESARCFPIRLVESGPAGGAILATKVARDSKLKNVVSFDMGGTTAKLCLIDGFQPQHARSFEIARAARFIKGSGMPVRIPVVEMIEIGAGGGSIAGIDRLGRLQVGPKSAGSDPGPAAFGRGGQQATVTDADLCLGLLDPESFAEGRLVLDQEAAHTAIEAGVGRELSLDVGEAARGISAIVDESMASAARMHAAESGKDLATRTMIAFGGNGPLHATRVARRAGITEILIPTMPGVGSAVGFLHAPISFETVRSRHTILDEFDAATLNTFLGEMLSDAEHVVRQGAGDAPIEIRKTAFARYRGQGHEVEVDVPVRDLTGADASLLKSQFETAYCRQYSRVVPGMDIEILNWSLRVTTVLQDEKMQAEVATETCPDHSGLREIRCDVTGECISAKLYARDTLTPGAKIAGPALITEAQTTTFVSADFSARVDGHGNLLLSRETNTEIPV